MLYISKHAKDVGISSRFLCLLLFLGLCGAISSDAIAQSLDSCSIFPGDNIWNTPVDYLPLDPNSSSYISTIGSATRVHPDFGSGTWAGAPIGIPYITVSGGQAEVPIHFVAYGDESDPGPYPVPANAPIEGGSDGDGDRHVLVVNLDNCRLYELYRAFPQLDGSWNADSGAVFDLNSHALRPDGWTSADAAGLPILPGLVRYDEVASGEIRHALRFTVPQTRRDYVWPARHFASSLTGMQYPPMGQRFRLKGNFDISGFSPEVQVILQALKTYGMILADNGSSWYISGAPDERWDNDVLAELHQVHGSDFEAVDVSSLMLDVDSGQIFQAASNHIEYGNTGTVVDKNKTSIWHSLVFTNSFTEVPVLLADLQTNWGGETAELRMQNLTNSGVELKIEEDKSADNENNHLAEDVGYLALASGLIRNAAGEVIGEAGSLSAKTTDNDDWETLTLQGSYTQPVLRMQIGSFDGRAPCHVRLRNVSGGSVEFQIEEWDHDDQFHGWETLNYVVLEAGDHTLPENVRLVAGNVAISADGSGLFTKILFSPVFAVTPVVLSQSQTYNDPAAIVTRQKDLRENRVKIRLVEEEAADQIHGGETVGYIAIGTQAETNIAEPDSSPDELLARSLDISQAPPTFAASADMEKAPSSQVEEALRLTPVPEPSTIVLLLPSLLGLYALLRKS